VIGLGYVGLPLAVAFGRRRPVTGFDIDDRRIAELRRWHDSTREVSADDLAAATSLDLASDPAALRDCGVFIVTVPTPVDSTRRPDLGPLLSASRLVGEALQPGDVVVYESTVYPGCTREVCVPVLEERSGLKLNEGFFVGYSPERINPGDPARRLADITKVTSGSTPAAARAVDLLYAGIVTAGTHMAASIEVAEAAKVIENTQRDLNIALMNELAIIFDRLGIDTLDVLAAAGTKWNFLPFRPGLVGGHCIGVDPYYLTHKAQAIGYHPEVILAGRRINDGMGEVIADRVVKLMLRRAMPIAGSRILVMGLTFKENCPDTRNTRVVDLVAALRGYHAVVDIYDPWVDPAAAGHATGLACLSTEPAEGSYDAVVVAVGHREFVEAGPGAARRYGKPNVILYDVKGIYPKNRVDGRL
jgi:UDP-N-acetyl-D-galactosamine dehydrogenase